MFELGRARRSTLACCALVAACTRGGSQELFALDATDDTIPGEGSASAPPQDASLADLSLVDHGAEVARSDDPVDVSDRGALDDASRSGDPERDDAGPLDASSDGSPLGTSGDAVDDAAAQQVTEPSSTWEAGTTLVTEADARSIEESTLYDSEAILDGEGGATADADVSVPDEAAHAAGGALPDAGTYAPATGGYQVHAAALLDSRLAVAHARGNVDFYALARDAAFGGFFTFLDQQGHSTSTNKSFGVQGRDAYAFVRAFMLTGEEAYLEDARFALEFLYAHGWDEAHDGFYFWGDRSGNPLPRPADVPSDKWSYAQNYALVGITAMCEATHAPRDCGWMDRALLAIDTHYRDATHGGYFDQASNDFRVMSGKGINPTVDAITTHALYAALVNGRASDRTRLLSLAGDAVDHLVANMDAPGVSFGFPVSYLSDWTIDRASHTGFVGHLFKTSWALARTYLVARDARYRDAARKVLRHMYEDGGFDWVNGAPNSAFDWTTGVTSTDKEYWQLEQAFTSGLLNWYVAGTDEDRAAFLEMADRSLDFFMTHLPDRAAGAVFFATNADGTVIRRRDKGDQWEGSYHDVELAYETYLSGNLLFWRRPATLYYRFDADAADRAIVLTPLAIEDEALVITGVAHDGRAYTAYDGPSRSLHIPAATSGVFAVTFAHTP